MAGMFSKISVYLWFGATVFFCILSVIFYNKRCGKFFQEASALSFGLGIIFFLLSGLFVRTNMLLFAVFLFVFGLFVFVHNRKS